MRKVYQEVASRVLAIRNCKARGNLEWQTKHADAIAAIGKRYLPHGNGIDSACFFDTDECTPDRLIIHTEFHHMDDNGFYNGWTTHDIAVRPSLCFGFNLSISGVNRDGIKDYLRDIFYAALNEEVTE